MTDFPRHEAHPLLVTHHFPLRPGLTVPVTLPVDLTEADAARLVGIIKTLTLDAAVCGPPVETWLREHPEPTIR